MEEPNRSEILKKLAGLPSLSEELIRERREEAAREAQTSDTEVPALTKHSRRVPELPSLDGLAISLSPAARAKAILQARIEILVQELVSTSAIEGIPVEPEAARRGVLRKMYRKAKFFR
jgi:hypothetical protein